MSTNTFLTATWVCRKGLIILHQKSNAAGRANRNYQDQFGPIDGVPVGTSINVRLPFKYIGRNSNQMSAENSVQRYQALSLANQYGVDVNFSSVERAQDLGSFEEQVLEPAIAQVAAKIETSVLANTNSFNSLVGTYSTSISMSQLMAARRFLTEFLAPEDMLRTLTANPQAHEEFVTNNAALYNPELSISEQFLEGLIAERVAGCTAFENTKVQSYLMGTYGATASGTVSGTAGQGWSSGAGNAYITQTALITSSWSSGGTTIQAGDVLMISGVYAVDPESKASLGRLAQFVATASVADSTGNLTVTVQPGIIYGGAYQNVCNSAGTGAAPGTGSSGYIYIAGQTTSTPSNANSGSLNVTVKQSLMWHRDAILFACVPMFDLSSTVKWTAREEYDGFSMRVAQIYDVDNDFLPCRIDTLSGSVVGLRELGCRVIHQATSY